MELMMPLENKTSDQDRADITGAIESQYVAMSLKVLSREVQGVYNDIVDNRNKQKKKEEAEAKRKEATARQDENESEPDENESEQDDNESEQDDNESEQDDNEVNNPAIHEIMTQAIDAAMPGIKSTMIDLIFQQVQRIRDGCQPRHKKARID
jgi:hypothetical protein